MPLSKLKTATVVLLLIAVVAVGSGGFLHRSQAGDQPHKCISEGGNKGDQPTPFELKPGEEYTFSLPSKESEQVVILEKLSHNWVKVQFMLNPGTLTGSRDQRATGWVNLNQIVAIVPAPKDEKKEKQGERFRVEIRVANAGPSGNVVVKSQIPGTVAERRVNIGDRVHKGDVLIRLDDQHAKADLQKAQANLKSVKADAPKADRDAAEAEVKKAKAFLAQHELRSPVDATVEATFRNVGDRIEKGETLLEIEATAKPRNDNDSNDTTAPVKQPHAEYQVFRPSTWDVEDLVVDGKKILPHEQSEGRVTFTGDKMSLCILAKKGSNYKKRQEVDLPLIESPPRVIPEPLAGESVCAEFTYHLSSSKNLSSEKPLRFDALPLDGPFRGKLLRGLCQPIRSNRGLLVCLPLRPDKNRPTGLNAPEGSKLAVLTLKRKADDVEEGK